MARLARIASPLLLACLFSVTLFALPALLGNPATVCAQDDLPCGWARIQGRVTATDTDAPLAGAFVTLFAGPQLRSTTTDSEGHYSLDYVPQGWAATMSVSPPGFAASGYLDNRVESAHYPSGAVTTVDIALERGATLTGQLVDLASGQPITTYRVRLFREGEPLSVAGGTIQNASGVFTLTTLESGRYLARFSRDNSQAGLDAWPQFGVDWVYSGDVFDVEQASVFSVTKPATVNMGVTRVGRGARINVTSLRADTTQPVAGFTIIYRNGVEVRGGADTPFGLGYLPTGVYTVEVQPAPNDLLPSFHYGDVLTPSQALPITITQADINQLLPHLDGYEVRIPLGGARVNGVVREAVDNAPRADATIGLRGQDLFGRTVETSTQTDASGTYTFTHLLPGSYVLFRSGPYANRPLNEAVTVTLTALDQVLTAPDLRLNPPRRIRGTITDPNGNPQANVEVAILAPPGNVLGLRQVTTMTNADGSYEMTVDAALGDFYVLASRLAPCNCFFRVFYAAPGSGDERTLLNVAPGTTLEGIDIECDCGRRYLPALRR